MVRWHHQLNGHGFEETPGDSEGQGSLVCCSPWGRQELDMAEQLNNNNKSMCLWLKKEARTLKSGDKEGESHSSGKRLAPVGGGHPYLHCCNRNA